MPISAFCFAPSKSDTHIALLVPQCTQQELSGLESVTILSQKRRTFAAAVIVTRALCCLTAADHCYVMPGTIKLNDKASMIKYHHDVISLRSEARYAVEGSWIPNWVYRQVIGNQTQTNIWIDSWRWSWKCSRSVYLLENIANFRVSCYDGNNDRAARVLFVQHPREQSEWCSQDKSVARPAAQVKKNPSCYVAAT